MVEKAPFFIVSGLALAFQADQEAPHEGVALDEPVAQKPQGLLHVESELASLSTVKHWVVQYVSIVVEANRGPAELAIGGKDWIGDDGRLASAQSRLLDDGGSC